MSGKDVLGKLFFLSHFTAQRHILRLFSDSAAPVQAQPCISGAGIAQLCIIRHDYRDGGFQMFLAVAVQKRLICRF